MVTVFSVATRFLSFLFKIYISRKLGAEAVGLYQMALSVYLLMFSFAASGLPVVLSRKIAENAADNGQKANRYLSATLIMSLGISVLIIAVFYIFRNQLKFIFADTRAMQMLLIMLPALISTSIYAALRSWFWGHKNFNAFSFSEMLEEIFRIFFTALLTSGAIAAVSPLKGLGLGFLLADIACVIILILMFFKNKGRFERPLGFKELAVSGAPVTTMKVFGGLMASLTALIIPAMLVSGGLSTSEATATFGRVTGMAMPLLMAPTTLTGALAVVLIPDIAAASTKNDSLYLRSRIEGSIVFSVFIASFFCILYLPLGREVAEIVFNDKTAGEFLSNSSILLYPVGLNQITLSMLNSIGMEKKSFLNYLVGTVFLLFSVFLLPKYIGVYAIAVGSGVCFTITSILNMRLLSKKVTLFDNTKKITLSIVFMPVCAATAFLMKMLLLPYLPKLVTVLLAGGIPMLMYLVLAVNFKIVDISRFYYKHSASPPKRRKRKNS